ncbi:AAA domain-containing protein [Ilumatobacter coccineus]|uniref:DNA2/NAM7 helicase-like C-terminal domain-containing protein n=1 Tax=Ilumatobacter coccineus (strain NBRC 103263 / KCTC 29153 / YM16-304) TaxID=1313172 RepID=A0A6C7EGX7_ILUCY|nr:AAA domain-containing protein [Ilumatobacter coccineus]BAN04399.1 hypothetical protein YM304_40850 [Ilumatobacter coccineus YM16-304]
MNPPAGYTLIPRSKYDDSCRRCGSFIPAGSAIFWSRSTREVLDTHCSHPATTNHAEAVAPEGDPNAEWRRLVSYLKRCVALEAADGLVDRSDARWISMKIGTETLISGADSALQVSKELREISESLRPGEVLQYGWPTVVVIDKSGVQRLAPLLVTELEASEADASALHAADDPYLNPSLLSSSRFDPADVDAVVAEFDDGIPTDQPDLLAALLDRTAEALGLQSYGVNRTRLEMTVPNEEGVHNVAVVIRTQNSAITRSLLQELTELEGRTDWRATGAAHLFEAWSEPAPREYTSDPPLLAPLALNDSQEALTARTASAPMTVATGPPGTGKSQMVVAAVSNSWVRSESTLLVSTNNAAVDVAVERAATIAPPMIMRTGNKTFRTGLPTLVSNAIEYSRRQHGDEATIRRDLASVIARRTDALESFARLRELDVSLIDRIVQIEGASSSIWGSTDAPPSASPDVIAPRAEKMFRIRFFRRYRHRRFLQSLNTQPGATVDIVALWARQSIEFEAERDEHAEISSRVVSVDLAALDAEWNELSTALVRSRIAASIDANDSKISRLCTAPDGGPGLANAIGQSLDGLKSWACTALALKPNFPLKAGLFDHVIVDEASQCSLATILPAAYRARRLTMVGDPNQLNPIVKLNESLGRDVAESSGFEHNDLVRRGLDHLHGSAFAAYAEAVGPDDVQLLDEHFRCHPLIARWFNSTFYGGRLTVLTDPSHWPTGQRGLQWIDTCGTVERPNQGSLINRSEAEQVVEQLDELLDGSSTVGVVTPFAAQARLIESLAHKRLDRERLAEADFTVGTAHRFQGSERDVVVFSTVIAPGAPPRSARWVERERNLLNVAASRARRALVVFGHPTAADEHNPTLSSLRRAAIDGPPTQDASWALHSESEARLYDALHQAGLAPAVKPYEEGFELDFAIITPSIKLNIEVDGSQHRDKRGRQRRRDIARDRILSELGWTVLRYSSWECMKTPDVVANDIALHIRTESLGRW